MVSTGQLDGERALKPKYALRETQDYLSDLIKERTEDTDFKVRCGAPSRDLFFFDGTGQIRKGVKTELNQLNLDNFLPRGSILRNSGNGILALTLYTGPDTKLI
jgi:hypothetical protein